FPHTSRYNPAHCVPRSPAVHRLGNVLQPVWPGVDRRGRAPPALSHLFLHCCAESSACPLLIRLASCAGCIVLATEEHQCSKGYHVRQNIEHFGGKDTKGGNIVCYDGKGLGRAEKQGSAGDSQGPPAAK